MKQKQKRLAIQRYNYYSNKAFYTEQTLSEFVDAAVDMAKYGLLKRPRKVADQIREWKMSGTKLPEEIQNQYIHLQKLVEEHKSND